MPNNQTVSLTKEQAKGAEINQENQTTKEQRTRYLKALLKKADQNLRIRDQQKKKAK